MRKGGIWSVEIPATNGHEQSGLRPVVILSQAEAGTVIIVPFTSNLQSLRFSHTIEINPSARNGLKTNSIALVFQLRAIDKRRLKNKIGMLDTKTMKEIDRMIRKILCI
jgi:mRNA interferase MazF